MKGYKIFKKNLKNQFTCRHYIFNEGLNVIVDDIILCHNGFHFCTDLNDCFHYYSITNIKELSVCLIEASGILTEAEDDCSKRACSELKILKILDEDEIYSKLSIENKFRMMMLNEKLNENEIKLLINSDESCEINLLTTILSKCSIDLLIDILDVLVQKYEKSISTILCEVLIEHSYLIDSCDVKLAKLAKLAKPHINLDSIYDFKLLNLFEFDDNDYIKYQKFALYAAVENINLKQNILQYITDMEVVFGWVCVYPEDKDYFIQHKNRLVINKFELINEYTLKNYNNFIM